MNRVKKILVSFVKNLLNNKDEPLDAQELPVEASSDLQVEEVAFEETEDVQVSSGPDEKEIDKLEELLRKALFGKEKKEQVAPIAYILNSGHDQWFYNPNTRSMIRVPGGSQLVVQDPTPDDDGKILCYCDFGFILVPFEEISPLGAN